MRRSQSGQVLAIVVLGAFVLFGAAALGIDVSRIFEERRAAQTAVDHAATAATFEFCSGADLAVATAAGGAAAARNGYDDAAPSISVSISQVGAASDYAIRASITSTIPGTFGRIVGFDTFTVSVEAIAAASGCAGTSGSGPGAIYAGGDNCTGGKYAVEISGSSDEVYGGVHSNSDARVGGASNVFTETTTPDIDDPWTYVGILALGSIGNGNVYQLSYPQDVGPAAGSWPAGWAPSDVTGGTDSVPADGSLLKAYYDLAAAGGTLYTTKVTSVTADGVYYTSSTDGMDVTVSPGAQKVVLVAPRGPIKVSGSNVSWTAITDAEIDALPGMGSGTNLALNLPRPGVLMLSNYQHSGIAKCDNYAIALSGSGSDWNGVLWAPGGLIEMSGSSNVSSNGTLLGWAVRLDGSELVIRFDSSLFATPADPEVVITR